MSDVTMAQAVKATAYPRQTLMRWIREGKLPAVKSGDATSPLLIPAVEVERIRQERIAEARQLLVYLIGQAPEVTREPESPRTADVSANTLPPVNGASTAILVDYDPFDDLIAEALGIPEMERA